ncbi:MAG: glycosyltransferase family 2 protein [Bacillota bacterium]
MKISALIPAYNEQETIGDIVAVLNDSEQVDNIIVINDGSTDNTGAVACRAGAGVIRLESNKGKGAALQRGFEQLQTDIILLLDGDLIGLQKQHVNKLLAPILEDLADMTVGVFTQGRGLTDLAQKVSPNLSGQRAIKMEMIREMKDVAREGFGFEIFLSRYIREHGRLEFVELSGLTHVMKEEKMGIIPGLIARGRMYWDIIRTLMNV